MNSNITPTEGVLPGLAALQGGTVPSYAVPLGIAAALMGLAAVGLFVWLLRRHLAARSRASLAIAEQGELLRTTLASIGDGVITTDLEGRVTNLNAVAEFLTGWTGAEAAGRPLHVVFNIVNESSRQIVENPAARALREGVIVGLANHTVLIAKDGTERPIDDSAAPIRRRDGSVVGCVLVFRDVTERRRAEARVQAERDRVQLVADAVPALISYVDANARYRLNNRTYETWFGHPPDYFAGRHMRNVLGEAAWSAIQPHVEAALSGRVVSFEAKVPYRDGGTRWILSTYTPDRGDNGEVRGLVAHVNDITERKRAEEEARASEAWQAFLVKLADTLRPLSDPVEVQAEASRVLGEQLGANRVAYFEVLGEDYVVARDYVRGVPTVAGRYPVASFGPELTGIYRSGRTAVEVDVYAAPAVSASERAAFDGIHTRAYVGVPLIKAGAFVAGLAVHMAEPRKWAAHEISAVEETAERTWAAVEQARAEQALRVSEERFRALFDTMDEGFCVVEMIFDSTGKAVDYRILEMNPAFEKHTGLRGVVGRTVRDFAPDLDEFWYETYGRVATTGEPIRFVNQAKALEDRWFDVYAFRLGGADSRKVAILFNDISARRRAEEIELHFKALFEGSPGMYLVLNPAFDIVAVSDAYLKATMTERSAIMGRNIFDVFPDSPDEPQADGAHNLRASLERVGTSRQSDVMAVQRYPVRRPAEEGGEFEERFWSLVNVPVLAPRGELYAIIHRVEDVTEYVRGTQRAGETDLPELVVRTQRMGAEIVQRARELQEANRQLRESEERFRNMADNAPVMIWVTDSSASCTYLNKQWYDFTGTTSEQGLGAGWLDSTHPDDKAPVGAIFLAANEKKEAFRLEYRLRRHDGEYRWAIDSGTPRFGLDGEFLGYIGSVVDIEERKVLEDNLRHLAADLSTANRRKDEFLATLAHELRNPLAPIRNGLQVMKLAKNNGEAVEQARSMMERQVVQMVRLIDDLMDLSRISLGRIELRRERVDLAKVVRQALETRRPLIEASGHDLTLDVPPEPIYVNADATRLEQVFSNLLNNAAKYTERGGQVRLTVQRQGNDARVSVRDNGVGIPASMLPQVFDIFTQVDRSLERAQGGLGIGLSLVKRLVEMHGGSVEARSDGHGLGSEFVVRLPVGLPPVQQGDATGAVDPAHSPARRRILVADDNLDAVSSLALLLSMNGHEVRTANDGLEAVEEAAAFRPDIVLLDIGMPRLNGYEACRHIREQPWGRTVVLIALTGWGQEEDRRQSRQAGFDHHIVKPVDPAALEKLLTGLQETTGS